MREQEDSTSVYGVQENLSQAIINQLNLQLGIPLRRQIFS